MTVTIKQHKEAQVTYSFLQYKRCAIKLKAAEKNKDNCCVVSEKQILTILNQGCFLSRAAFHHQNLFLIQTGALVLFSIKVIS